MAPCAKFFVVRGVLVDGVAHAAEAQPAEPHRGPPEDDLRGGARLQELEGMCAADILLNESGVLQLHDLVVLDVLLLVHVVFGREIREIRIRPRLRHCKCWPCDALRQPRSPVWLKVLVSPGIASAY